MRKDRILVISMYYKPEPNFVTADIAEMLCKNGYDVTVVTSFPSYPLGKYYESVSSIWPKMEMINGVKVLRLPGIPDHSCSLIKRAVSYLLFAFIAGLCAPFVCFRPKVVLVYQTPFFSALATLFFKWFQRAKLLYICVDLWPESLMASKLGVNRVLVKGLYLYSRWINRRADMIITTTKGMHRRYRDDGIPERRLKFIPVWVEASHNIHQREEEQLDINDPLRIVYAGNLGPAQDLSTVVKAAKILKDMGSNTIFDIYGTGSCEEALQMEARQLGVSNINFYGYIPANQIYEICGRSSAQIVHLLDSPLFNMTVPSKLAFSLGVGKPILCGAKGEAAELLHESNAGWVFEPSNPLSLADAVRKLEGLSVDERRALEQNARNYFERFFDPVHLLKCYRKVVMELVG